MLSETAPHLRGGAPFLLSPRVALMERPTRFEHNRWLGDKRTQVVYDVDELEDESIIEELMASEAYLAFGPDTLAEARNRGYHPYQGSS
jgi:hypothetical protein